MPVTIHLVRHAQGFHNLNVESEQLRDPELTDLGKSQCASVRANFPSPERLTHLVASPLRRTLQTCLLSFGPGPEGANDGFDRSALLPVVALPEIQECSDNPCDTGSPVSVVEPEFRGKVDFSRVPDDWIEKKSEDSPWGPTAEKLEARALKARLFLRDLAAQSGKEDVHIAAVSHGGFLHFLTGDWHGVPLPRATSWENCEYRSYQFVDPTGQDPEARIQETDESWRTRQGESKRPTPEEQAELRRTYVRELGGLFIKESPLPN